MKKKDNKLVLILESVGSLDSSTMITESITSPSGKKKNNYIFEGVFAKFGKANNNNRIYEAEDYKKHIPYLQERIKNANLFGELDHPADRYDVSMQLASHMIENLHYDAKTDEVKGTIKLLNTTQGKNAKAIVDAGGKLHISSRAAGIVNESNRKVTLKKIFTYDIVNVPGFAEAELKLINNESLGINNENLKVYEVSESFIKNTLENSDDQYLKESLNELLNEVNMLNGNTEIYNKNTNNKSGLSNMKEAKNSNMSEFVTANQLQKWSKTVKESYDGLENKIKLLERQLKEAKEIKNSKSINESVSSLDPKVQPYLNYLAKNLNNVIHYTNYLASGLNKDLTSVQESIDENSALTNKLKGFVDYLASTLNETISVVNISEQERTTITKYLDYLSEELNTSVNHTDHVAQTLNKSIGYANYLSEKLNTAIGHGDHLAERVNTSIGYSNYLAENLDLVSDYTNVLAENLNISIGHTDHVASTLNDLVQYTEYIGENSLNSLPGRSKKVNEGKTLNSKIENFLNSTFKRDEYKNNERKLTSLLSASNYAKFNALQESEKTKLVEAFSTTRIQNEYDVVKLWEDVLYTEQDLKLKVLYDHMPPSIKPMWESLSPERKLQIENRAKYYTITNSLQAKNFWISQDMIDYKTPNQVLKENLSEAVSQHTINESAKFGSYNIESAALSKDYIKNRLERFK